MNAQQEFTPAVLTAAREDPTIAAYISQVRAGVCSKEVALEGMVVAMAERHRRVVAIAERLISHEPPPPLIINADAHGLMAENEKLRARVSELEKR
ncbi:MAG: hypothetical protein WC876_01935 [Candidatus Thermoplasmatota archaeon]|jgi:hypothetical protein